MIKLNGRNDNAIIERLLAISFKSYFTSNENTLADTRSEAQRGNGYYKTSEFRKKYRVALFHYLLKFGKHKLYICKEAERDTKLYLEDNNDMLAWFKENYQSTEDQKQYVRISDVFNMWKQSENYINLPKATKRKMNRNYFINEHIYGNPDMRKMYSRQFKVKDDTTGVVIKTISNVIYGYKKQANCLIKDDDDDCSDDNENENENENENFDKEE
jgi:hypothetical protein